MGLGFTLAGQDCVGTTEDGRTGIQTTLHRRLCWLLDPAALPGAGSSSTLHSASAHRNHLPPLPPVPGQTLDAMSADGWHSRFFFFHFLFQVKWSDTDGAVLASQSLTGMWAYTCLSREAQLHNVCPKSCRNDCADQSSLNQCHTWQRCPSPAFIWMGGFVPLVLTSPHLMPVSSILPEVQQAVPQKFPAAVSNTHAALGKSSPRLSRNTTFVLFHCLMQDVSCMIIRIPRFSDPLNYHPYQQLQQLQAAVAVALGSPHPAGQGLALEKTGRGPLPPLLQGLRTEGKARLPDCSSLRTNLPQSQISKC